MDLRHELALAAATALGLVGCASAERAAPPAASPAPPAPIVEREAETVTATESADEPAPEGLAAPPPGLPAAPAPAPVSGETVAPRHRQPRVSCGASCGGSCGEPDQDDDE